MSSAMRLATGHIVDCTVLKPEQVRAWDFAWGLHHINRYLGHCPVPWSVLSHTGLCYLLLMQETKGAANPLDKLGVLLHDAPEAYIGDMPRPLKYRPEAAFFRDTEDTILRVLLARFGLAYDDINWELVRRYDDQALHIEMHTLMPDLRTSTFLPPPVYDSGYPRLAVCKPWDYVQLIREIAINLPDSTGHPIDLQELFFLPDFLALYAKPQEEVARPQRATPATVQVTADEAALLNAGLD